MFIKNSMDEYVYVLFFSKFSDACKNFIAKLESNPEIKNNIASVCIDNKKVRERISKDGMLQISKVPCIMKVYELSGKVEQYEGDVAFSIFNVNIPKNKKTSLSTVYEDAELIDIGDSKIPLKQNEMPSRGIVSKQEGVTNMANQMQKEREELFPTKQQPL